MSKVIALLLLSLLAVSCGEKKGMSSVKLKLFQSSITTGTDMSGGILLMGRSEDGLNSFRTSIASSSESLSMDLAKGRWEFAAVAWSNTNGPMTGDNRCAYSGFVDLKDTEVNVTFNMTQERCLTSFNGNQFSDSSFMTSSGKFLEFYPIMCNTNVANAANCYSGSNPTSIVAYRIVYKSEAKGLAAGSFAALSSNCLGVSTSVRARVPVISGSNGSPLKVTLQLFKNAACDGSPELSYDFNNGIAGTQLPIWSQVVAQSTYYSYLYLNPGAQYDMMPVNPGTFNLISPVNIGGPVFNSNTYSYVVSTIPENVSEVCFTVDTVCPAGKWVPKSLLTANFMLDTMLTDGTYYMKLFYKTVSQVESTTPAEALFSIDITPPVAPVINNPSASVTNGINVSWSSTDESVFDRWIVYICSDDSCGTYLGSKEIYDFNTKSVIITSSDFYNSGTISLGQSYCVYVKAMDAFMRPGQSTRKCVAATN